FVCMWSLLASCLFTRFHEYSSQRISSPASVVALAGEDVLLPCRLQPPISDSSITVEWTRPGLDPGYIHDHQVYHSQNPGYQYRTALFVDQLINGNVSLKLFRVKMSDAGKYRCFLPSLQMESFVHLSVGKRTCCALVPGTLMNHLILEHQVVPDLPPLGDAVQLCLGNPKAFPDQPRDIIPPAGSGSAPGSPPGSPPRWTCSENLQRKPPRRHPNQMSKPPQLAPLDVKEQRLYSELPPDV
uniref:Ig-like domain-containing protein n=1 Tax=Stegastes partitus TaxID=144197 RepID=A0A3B4ZGC2_9TELE